MLGAELTLVEQVGSLFFASHVPRVFVYAFHMGLPTGYNLHEVYFMLGREALSHVFRYLTFMGLCPTFFLEKKMGTQLLPPKHEMHFV